MKTLTGAPLIILLLSITACSRLGTKRSCAVVGSTSAAVRSAFNADAGKVRVVMAKSKDKGDHPSLGQPHRALLFELKGEAAVDEGSAATETTEMFAALSIEEVIAFVRRREPGIEIMGLRVLGKVQVLSSSEHLA